METDALVEANEHSTNMQYNFSNDVQTRKQRNLQLERDDLLDEAIALVLSSLGVRDKVG
jgi:hypothetical protein